MRKPYTLFPLATPNPITNESFISVPMVKVRLGIKGITTPRFDAVVDSGSPSCLFHTDFAKLLKLDLEAGIVTPLSGVHGSTADAYFHKIKIYVESDWVFEVLAGFVKGSNVNGLLGRHGFFDNFHVGFDHSVKPPEFEITRIQRPS